MHGCRSCACIMFCRFHCQTPATWAAQAERHAACAAVLQAMVDQVDAQSVTQEQRAAELSWVPMATAMSDSAASSSEAAHEVAAVMHDLL